MVTIRTLALTGVFLVAVGLGLPPAAFAQVSGQGQAVGILFLLGASQGNAKAPGQKPKPAVSREAQGKIVGMKPTTVPAVRDGSRLVSAGPNGKHN